MTQLPDSLDLSRVLDSEGGGGVDGLYIQDPWPGSDGVNELIGKGAWDMTNDGAWVQDRVYIAVNYDGDEVFDRAWQLVGPETWITTTDGHTWYPSTTDPMQEWIDWGISH